MRPVTRQSTDCARGLALLLAAALVVRPTRPLREPASRAAARVGEIPTVCTGCGEVRGQLALRGGTAGGRDGTDSSRGRGGDEGEQGDAAACDAVKDATVPAKGRVTKAALQTLFHLPVPDAASRVGMATTSFKKLCRRMGIEKWPYRRHARPTCADAGSGPLGAREHASHGRAPRGRRRRAGVPREAHGAGRRAVKQDRGGEGGGARGKPYHARTSGSDCRKRARSTPTKRAGALCRADGCSTYASYGNVLENKARFCAAHKGPEHVHMNLKHCQNATCTRWASFGTAEDGVLARCARHKLSQDLDLRNRRCVHPRGSAAMAAAAATALCKRQPSYGMPGSKVATHCALHRVPGQVDLKNERYRCRFPAGCRRMASFGHVLYGRPLYCSAHKEAQEGLVNIRTARCDFGGGGVCSKQASFVHVQALALGQVQRYCPLHKFQGCVRRSLSAQPREGAGAGAGEWQTRTDGDSGVLSINHALATQVPCSITRLEGMR